VAQVPYKIDNEQASNYVSTAVQNNGKSAIIDHRLVPEFILG